jgi:hypothetical protein
VKSTPSRAALPVSELNLRKTAMRVLGQRLVSPEVHYLQRILGASTTQDVMDAAVLSVRKMPWAKIVPAE